MRDDVLPYMVNHIRVISDSSGNEHYASHSMKKSPRGTWDHMEVVLSLADVLGFGEGPEIICLYP